MPKLKAIKSHQKINSSLLRTGVGREDAGSRSLEILPLPAGIQAEMKAILSTVISTGVIYFAAYIFFQGFEIIFP